MKLLMQKRIKNLFIEPNDGSPLNLEVINNKIVSLKNNNGKYYKNDGGVIDFVGNDNYAANFGYQWSRWPKIQLDSYNRTKISSLRFFAATGLTKESLKNKLILDVGCGTGRFAEIALECGAFVIAIDYSNATKVAAKNLSKYENFLCIQANIYKLPFKSGSFDLVYCLGVLQHTPNVESAFKNIALLVKSPGGLICVDYYWKRLRTLIAWKYLIRPITSKLNELQVLKILQVVHPFFYPIAFSISKIPKIGKFLARLVPVICYKNVYKELDDNLLRAWSFLDTYDAWAPKYDNPQTRSTIKKWALDMNLSDIEIEHVGHLVLRAKYK